MANVTKIVIEFDDGTTQNVDPTQYTSIFVGESKAKKCGHNPPYDKPPKNGNGTTTTAMASTTEEETGGCYYVNGVIVCP